MLLTSIYGVCAMKNEEYININEVAKAKGLSSNRSLRIAIQKGKYIAREVTVFSIVTHHTLQVAAMMLQQQKALTMND